jgi:hypothetical protein
MDKMQATVKARGDQEKAVDYQYPIEYDAEGIAKSRIIFPPGQYGRHVDSCKLLLKGFLEVINNENPSCTS